MARPLKPGGREAARRCRPNLHPPPDAFREDKEHDHGSTPPDRFLRQGWHRQVDHLPEHARRSRRDGPEDPDRRLRSQGRLDAPHSER